MERLLVSDNRLRIELTTVSLMNTHPIRSPARDVHVGFAITGLDPDDEPVVLTELVESIPCQNIRECDLDQCVRDAAHRLSARLGKLAEALKDTQGR